MDPITYTLDENIALMERAIASVRTGEVTLAARATRVHGMAISKGQPIGLVDGDLVVAAATVAEAARECVRHMIDGREAVLVTLYAGAGDHLQQETPQDLRSAFGKIHRFLPDGGIPADNPFVGSGGGRLPSIWAYGSDPEVPPGSESRARVQGLTRNP